MRGATNGTAAAGSRPVAATVLGATVALAVFSALSAAVLLVVHPDLGDLITARTVQQNQGAKTLLYLVAFSVLTPLAGVAGHRLAARGMDAVTPAVGLGLAFVVARVAGGGLDTLLIAVVVCTGVAALATVRGARLPPVLAVLTGAGAVLCFTHLSAARLAALAVAVAAVAAVTAFAPSVPRLRGRRGAAADALVLALLVLAVPDLVVFTTSGALPNVFTQPGIIQFHHDFLLGPTNQVLGGGTLLVDSPVSQYGVGTVYFLAAWFHLAPIGYGTYGLLDGILTAGSFAAAYGLLRLAGTSRPLAAGALAVGVVAFVLHLVYPIGALPQGGPLRFGLPLIPIVAMAAALHRPDRARVADGVAFAALGVAAIWSIEALAFTAMTVAGLLVARARLRPAGDRRRWLLRRIAIAVAAAVIAHVVLLLATLARSGSLPDWGQYLAYLRAFLGGGEAGELTYGFEPWSPGLAMGALYAASAIGVGILLHREDRRNPVTVVALAGLTAYGIALFSYVQNRSSTYLLPYVALPALLVAVLWAGVMTRDRRARGALAALGLVLLASALPVGDRFSRTPLAHLRPGGHLHAALARLWHPPPIDPRAPAAQQLLDRFMPGRQHVLVLLPKSPELGVETLLRSRRANALPVGNPVEESFVPDVWAPPLRRAIARLKAGQRVLVDDATLLTLATLRAHPAFDPLAKPKIGEDAIDAWILREVGRRFDLRTLARDRSGLRVAELVPR